MPVFGIDTSCFALGGLYDHFLFFGIPFPHVFNEKQAWQGDKSIYTKKVRRKIPFFSKKGILQQTFFSIDQ